MAARVGAPDAPVDSYLWAAGGATGAVGGRLTPDAQAALRPVVTMGGGGGSNRGDGNHRLNRRVCEVYSDTTPTCRVSRSVVSKAIPSAGLSRF